MNELIKMTARQVVALLQKKEVSPLELVELSAERILEVDSIINAIPIQCFDRARSHARAIMDNPPDPVPHGYLYGLPLAIKDLDEVEGVRTTYGSPIFADNVSTSSGYMVETLENNGSIVMGKSNTPEFGSGGTTFNEVFGVTVNPWDISKTCGGSSGGAAAALASGQVWLAQGTDFAGSVRTPASFCSIVGLRPSPGRIATGPEALPFSTFSVRGPMARTVGDTALMLDAMCGMHPADPRSLPRPAQPFVDAVDAPKNPCKIGFSPNLGVAPVDPEVVRIVSGAAAKFQDIGCEVVEGCPDFGDAIDVFQTLRSVNYASRMGPLLEKYRDQLKPEVIWNIEKSFKLTSGDIAKADKARGDLFHSTIAFFKDHDFLLTPTVVAPPFSSELRYLPEVNGTRFDSYIGWLTLTFVLTLTGCPTISVPCGFTSAGLPVGMQIVGRPRDEAGVLSAAALFEQACPLEFTTPINPQQR
ncbi:amidase [Desulforhopalus singaporensis]|uniref:Amidase n=1 Tax=Desulforhopalus singaporensis TaxID=91360 RepID=A0A1H0VFF6_9BACT|nr:amidase family protein [Desulforhopalus singaporensis]SDP76806.1 amidase [Desulforhopalus singaporensis]